MGLYSSHLFSLDAKVTLFYLHNLKRPKKKVATVSARFLGVTIKSIPNLLKPNLIPNYSEIKMLRRHKKCLRPIFTVSYCWISFFLFVSMASSQQVLNSNLKVEVTDKLTGEKLYGAIIELSLEESDLKIAATSEYGTALFKELVAGQVKISVSHIGYQTHQSEFFVGIGKIQTLNVKLNRKPIELEPVEVLSSPQTISQKRSGTGTKIDAQTVDLIQPIGTQEILELVPGINAYADDGFGNSRLSIGIRGLNPRRSSRVLIMEDAVPIQPAIYIYPNAYYNPPSERIESVEVIKGSSAIRFGPQTMGGIINYKTRTPDGSKGFVTHITGGNNGYLSSFLEWQGLGTAKFSNDAQFLYKQGDGFRQNNGFRQVNTTWKTQYRLSPKKLINIKLNANYEDSKATYTGLTEYSFRNTPNFNPKEHDRFKIIRTSLDLMYTSVVRENLISNTTLYLNVFDRRWWREDDIFVRAPAFNKGGDLEPVPYFQSGDLVRTGGGVTNFGILRTFFVGGIAQDYDLQHRNIAGSVRAEFGARIHWERFLDDKKVGSSPQARDGIYFRRDPDESNGKVTILGQSHHYETAALSLYFMENFQIGKMSFDPGFRVEIFKQQRVDRLRGSVLADKVSTAFLPGFGVNYRFDRIYAFAGIHRGFTPPSSGTLKITNFGQDSTSNGDGLDLRAEKSWNMEVGLRSLGSMLNFEGSAFLVKIQDLVAAGRGTAFKNLGQVDTYGLEVGLLIRTSQFSSILPDFNIAYTYLQTEIKKGSVKSATMAGNVVDLMGKQLPYAPPHSVNFGLSKKTSFGLNLIAGVRFIDEVFTDFENIEKTNNRGDTGPVPSHSIINVSADYSISKNWMAFISAKNLLDKVYIGSRLHSNPGQPEANLSSGILIGSRRQVNFGIRRSL